MKFIINYSPLTSNKIMLILRNAKTKGYVEFCGVYASDTLPKKNVKKGVYIVNYDASDQPGSHWVLIYLSKNNFAYYFDSYGVQPAENHHLNFIQKNVGKRWKYNKVRLQSDDSSVCGHYCCVFYYFLSQGKSTHDFTQNFNFKNYYENDAFIMLSFGEIFSLTQNCKKKGEGKG